MGDVAAILGIARPSAGAGGIDFADTGAFKRRVSASLADDDAAPVKAKKSKISREVSALLGSQPSEVIAPLVPVRKIAIGGFKEKAGSKSSKKWAWKQFTSSARRDGLQLHHWVRADAEYTDYPFARFKSRTDIIKYTDSEYQDMLEQDRKNMKREQYEQIQDQWPKDQTDHLFDLARRFELRWPLILDRWEKKPTKSIEELKRRFFTVTSRILRSRRMALPAPIDENGSDPRRLVDPRETFEYKFDADKLRRKQLENAFGMLNESTQEERRLLKELASVETQIRKIEKKLQSGGVALSLPAGGAAHAGAAEAEHYPGSELMAARNLAAKSHAPVLLPSDAASASVSALQPPRKLVGAGSVASRTTASSASQHHLMTPEANPFTLPVALRTMQMAVAPDALPADSRALLKTSMTAAALHVPDKPLPSLRIMTAMNQLRREMVNLSILSREVDLLEADVYRLEHVRKSAGLNNFNGNAKPTFDAKDVAHKIKAGELRPDAPAKQAEASARLVTSLAVQHPLGVRAGSALLVHAAAATGGPGVTTLVTLSAGLPKEAKAAAQAILDKRAANGKERVRERDEAAARAAAAEAAALTTPAGPPESTTSHVVVKQEPQAQGSPVVHAHPAPAQPRLTPATSVGGGMAAMGVPSTSAGSGMPPASVPSSASTTALLAAATASPQGGGVKGGQLPPAAVGTPTGAVKGSSLGGLTGVASLPAGVPLGGVVPAGSVPPAGPGTASAVAGGMKQAGLPTVPSAQSLTGPAPSSFFSAPMSNIQSTFYPLPGVSAGSSSVPFLPPLPTLSNPIESLRQPAAGTGTPASAAPPASMGLPRIGSAQALSTPSISVPTTVSAAAAAAAGGGAGGGAGTPAGSNDSGARQTRNKRGREASEVPAVKKGKTE